MKRSTEIRQKISNKKTEVQNLKNAGKLDEAVALAEEIRNLGKELVIAEAEEMLDIENLANGGKTITADEKINSNRVLNKCLTGKKLTEKEQEYANKHLISNVGAVGQVGAVDERGGFLLTEEHEKEIKEWKRKRKSLKSLCRIKNVKSRSGKFNVEGDNKLTLLNFEELDTLQEKDLKFAQKSWAVKDYGLLIPVAKQLLQDIDVNLMSFIGNEFAKASVRTENNLIIEKLKTATAKTIKTVDDIGTILNVDLDPAIAEGARIVTNQTSFDWLDRQKDGNGLPLLQPCLTEPTKKMFKGKIIEVFSDEEIKSDTVGNLIFYIGDFEEFVTFYDRLGTEIAKSDEAGFKQYTTYLRIVQRFDVGVVDEKAVIKAELTPSKANK